MKNQETSVTIRELNVKLEEIVNSNLNIDNEFEERNEDYNKLNDFLGFLKLQNFDESH